MQEYRLAKAPNRSGFDKIEQLNENNEITMLRMN